MEEKVKDVTSQRVLLERARGAFSSALAAFEKNQGRYIDRAPEIPQQLLSSAKLYQNRFELLEDLPKNSVVAEVGTDTGAFAARIFETCQPQQLHVFELDITRIVADNLRNYVRNGLCIIHAGESAVKMAEMPDGFFDWIYVDGDHSFSGVQKDIEASAPKVKPGGLLVFNDYNVWSVTSMRKCGVARAVNMFAKDNGWAVKHFAFQSSMYCDISLQKPLV